MLSDTPPNIEQLQIELLCRKTTAERVAMVRSMTVMAGRLSRRAIERANPGASSEEIDCKFIELHYGKELANRYRDHLQTRQE